MSRTGVTIGASRGPRPNESKQRKVILTLIKLEHKVVKTEQNIGAQGTQDRANLTTKGQQDRLNIASQGTVDVNKIWSTRQSR